MFMAIIIFLGGGVEENLILTLIQGLGKMYDLSSITACISIPDSEGEHISGDSI